MIPGSVPRAQLRTTLTFRLTPRLQAGIEINPRSTEEKANPLVNWLAVPERRTRPPLLSEQAQTGSERRAGKAST